MRVSNGDVAILPRSGLETDSHQFIRLRKNRLHPPIHGSFWSAQHIWSLLTPAVLPFCFRLEFYRSSEERTGFPAET